MDMETLFIADDEFSIREGLKRIIDWNSLGFQLCGEAANGDEALEKILALNPSLVLLDVKMPELHGTEVIRLAREAGFQGKCIILSGYSDFKYAQEAIKSNVRFYLTKPLDEDELYTAVKEIKELIEQEKAHSDNLTALQNKAKNVTLYELITDTLPAPLSSDTAKRMNLLADSYQIVICEDFNKQDTAAPYTFAQLIKVTNNDDNVFEHIEADNKDVVLLKGAHGLDSLARFLADFEYRPLQNGSPMDSMFITYGRPVYSLSDVHLSYKDALTLLGRRFFCAQRQHALGYNELPQELKRISEASAESKALVLDESLLDDFVSRFIDYIQSYNRKMVVETLSDLEDTMMQIEDDINNIKLFLTDIYLQIREIMNRNYASEEIPFKANSTVIDFISTRNYLYEIIRFLSEQFEMIMSATGNPSRNTVLDDILSYIDHNFTKNIKLETIAPLFGYTSGYLGKIFIKTVGQGFNTYIDLLRINYSKELLLENKMKVYQIAEQVGYKNVDYFHKKFKKYVGESPAEFRKQNYV